LATMRSGRGANHFGDLRGSRAGRTGLSVDYGMRSTARASSGCRHACGSLGVQRRRRRRARGAVHERATRRGCKELRARSKNGWRPERRVRLLGVSRPFCDPLALTALAPSHLITGLALQGCTALQTVRDCVAVAPVRWYWTWLVIRPSRRRCSNRRRCVDERRLPTSATYGTDSLAAYTTECTAVAHLLRPEVSQLWASATNSHDVD
jgi:hypothetical protein